MGGENVGSIAYDARINTKDFISDSKTVNKEANSLGDSIAKGFKNAEAGSKILLTSLVAAAAGAVAFGVASLKAFQESEDVIAQTNAVIKSTGGAAGIATADVLKLASALQKSTAYSDEQVASAENMLLTFTSIGKDVFPQATKTVLDMSTALGQDTKASAIQLGKALQDPIRGITALRRVGVNFTDKQKDVIQGLVDTGKTAEAQKLILAELNREFGGSAEAAGKTFAGSIQRLKNSFNDLQEELGKTISKALVPLADKFSGLVKTMEDAGGILPFFTKMIERNQVALKTIAGAITAALLPALVALAGGIAAVVLPLVPFLALGAALAYTWQKAKPIFFAVAGVFAFLAGSALVTLVGGLTSLASIMAVVVPLWLAANAPMIAWIAAAAAVGAAAYLVVNNWETVKGFFVGLWQKLQEIFGGIGKWFGDRFREASDAVTGAFSVVKDTVKGVFDAISGFIEDHQKAIRNWAIVIGTILLPKIVAIGVQFGIAAVKTVASFVVMSAQAVAHAAVTTAAWVASAAQTAFVWVTQTLPGIIASFAVMSAQAVAKAAVVAASFVASSVSTLVSWGITFAGYIAGIVIMVAQTAIAALQMAASWLLALGPLGLIAAAVIGLTALIINNWDTVKQWISTFFDWLKAAFDATVNFVKNNWQTILAIMTGPIGLAVLFITKNFETIKAAFAGIRDWVANIFAKIGDMASGAFKGVVNGVLNMVEKTVNGFIKLINGAINTINKLPGVDIGKVSEINLPRLAEGGIVKSRPGGILANIGEGGRDEAVIPLDKLDNMVTGSKTGDIVINVDMKGIMARSKADLRDITKEMLNTVNDELRAKRIEPIGGGAI